MKHSIKCYRLLDGNRLIFAQLCLDTEQNDTITILTSENGGTEKLCINEIEEIRPDKWTDAWFHAKPVLKSLIAKAKIRFDPIFYFSIVFKSTQKLLPGKTEDFITADSTAIDLLKNVVEKICQKSNRIQSLDLQSNQTENEFLDSLFLKYSIQDKPEYMISEGLQHFYRYEQRTAKTQLECRQLISSYEKSSTNFYLTLKGFYRLFEEQFPLFDPKHEKAHQETNHPMTHYFIASSHNTYLTGHQWNSESSCEMYRNILLDGCRCVEIDVWARDGKPVVSHGYTRTSSILLSKVLKTIAKYAFVTTNYPLILSIENHLIEHENKMEQLMRKNFGDKLCLEDVNDFKRFPSLELMMGKIFVKASKGKPKDPLRSITNKVIFGTRGISAESDSSMQNDDYMSSDGKPFLKSSFGVEVHEVDSPYLRGIGSSVEDKDLDYDDSDNDCDDDLSDVDSEDDDSDYDYEDEDEEEDENEKDEVEEDGQEDNFMASDCLRSFSIFPKIKKSKNRTFPKLINFFEAKKFTNIKECINKFEYYHMFSRTEDASKKIWTQNCANYQRFTRTNMARVYPHWSHVDSSNFRPMRHWNAGVQMVALNYQTANVEMQINWAMFSLNGGCGYVLKPKYLRDDEKDMKIESKVLKIQILTGNFEHLTAQNQTVNLKVQIRVYAPEADSVKRTSYWKEPKCTESVASINPTWNIQTFSYELSNPELSFVQFQLMNGKSVSGQHMIAFQAMQKGYRSISLCDTDLKPIPYSKLYLHVDY